MKCFVSNVTAFPNIPHIGKDKDFTPVIEKALELGGYPEGKEWTGIHGGKTVVTGFGHGAVLSVADQVIHGVQTGAIRHLFLVAGATARAPDAITSPSSFRKRPRTR